MPEGIVSEPIRLGRYRHFKGAVYVVVGTATHSEDESAYVVYHREGDDRLWVRPAAMWSERVIRDGITHHRFTPLD